MANHERLLTAAQAASFLNVKVTSLMVYRSRGTGPRFLRKGRRVFYRLDDLIEYREEFPDAENPGADRLVEVDPADVREKARARKAARERELP